MSVILDLMEYLLSNKNQSNNDSEDKNNHNNYKNDDQGEDYKEKYIEKDIPKKEIAYPKDQEEEDKLFQLALKQSEEEEKLRKEREKKEEEELLLALKESEKQNYYNNNFIYENNFNFNFDEIDEDKIYNESNEIKKIKEIKEIKEEEFDEEYGICPITQEYMTNPVITPYGNYYEKSAIIDWIEKNKTDPLTREPLTVDMLMEDEEYKIKIIEYRKKFNK